MEYAGKSTNEKLACAVLLKQCILDLPWDVVVQMQVTMDCLSVKSVRLIACGQVIVVGVLLTLLRNSEPSHIRVAGCNTLIGTSVAQRIRVNCS